MFLIDTNIFLEILLGQEKKTKCKKFLEDNTGRLNITDFTLHSMGVILFKHNKESVFRVFIEDILPKIGLLSLPGDSYGPVIKAKKSHMLDFDDAYQYGVAKHYGFTIVTMDKHFKRTGDTDILFL